MKPNLSLLQADNAFYAEREQRALSSARRNALRRIVRCVFAEKIVDPALLVFVPGSRNAWLPLWSTHALLFFADLEAAPADTVVNHGEITLIEADGTRVVIDEPGRLIDLLRPHFNLEPAPDGVSRLQSDMANSIDNDAFARIYRDAWNKDLNTHIATAGASGLIDYLRKQMRVRDAAVMLDQWGSLEGHPFYPTWKSKPDLNTAEVAALSPEFNACVPVRIAALRADMAYVETMPHVDSYRTWFATQFPQVWQHWKDGLAREQIDEQQWLPLPIHSWHLEHFVRREYAAEIEDGVLIVDGPDIDTWPTMSFRTMMPRLPGPVPFIKLPVALWLTSEQRSLQAKSIHMGPRVSAVIERIVAAENGFDHTFEIFPEEVALHYRHAQRQDDAPGRYLSVAYRSSTGAFERTDGLLPVTVAALFAPSPVDHRALVTELIERDGEPATADTVDAWFRHYVRVVTGPVVGIYLLYGIGLEAHQQNATVLFSADGMAAKLLIRDFGDGRTFEPLLDARGYALQPYEHPGILPTVFNESIEPVRAFVVDACFVCHLHELALLLTRTYDLPPHRLWAVIREETARSFDAVASRVDPALWQTERAAFLDQPWPTRSVLRMHLLRYSNYRLQHDLSNPLRAEQAGD